VRFSSTAARVGFIVLSIMCLLSSRPAAAASFVWVEGEQPKACNLTPDVNGSGRPTLLSGGKWLTLHMDAAEAEKQLPAEGALVTYAFKAEQGGKHHLWARVGYEFARSAFDWRIDNGDWTNVKSDDLTTDLTELSFFTEVAWLNLGQRDLAAGDHTFEIRIPKRTDAKGKSERLLLGLDALCFTTAEFLPNGPFKPGEDWRTEQDKQAAKTVFTLPDAPADGVQAGLPLQGLWEICRDDEQLPKDVASPIAELPKSPFWKAIPVPGDKNKVRDDLVFAHRLWYRTKVTVPASQKGRSFYLIFPQNNLNTTVYVNGVLCGFNKHPFVRFQIDVTKGMKVGENELWVGIRDAWYGYSASPTDPMKLRRRYNTPLQVTERGFQDLAYPVWHTFQSGILITPTLVSAGPTYVSDVFCKPSVAKKELALEVTVTNPDSRPAAGEVMFEAVDAKSGAVAKQLGQKAFSVEGGKEQVLQHVEAWADAKLWWPDEPNMYRLRATVKLGGKVVDVSHTPFGFREWGSRGKDFTLNGIVWHGWNMGIPHSTPEQFLENYRKLNQTQVRMSGATQGGLRPFFGLSPDEALDWMDQHGIVVRRCGILDGEAIGYMAIENDPELKKLYDSPIKMELMNNWVEQMAAQVKGERNHPSIQVWSIENEWLYINCINLYGGLMDKFEEQVYRCAEAVRAVDPTRLSMVDGGGAGKSNGMPVHGDHYVAESNFTKYPALAYAANPKGGGRGRWEWDQKRPRYLGEDFFYTGYHAELATIGGEICFGGKTNTLAACGLVLQILQQGYRWADYGAWDFYCGQNDADNTQWKYMAPRVVLCRQWDWTFGSGQRVPRTMAVFNDTRYADPIAFTWALTVGGKKVAGETKEYAVAPGTRQEFELPLAMPQVAARQEGELTLSLAVKGAEVWKDAKAISVLPTSPTKDPTLAALGAQALHVYDPAGTVAPFLKARGIAFTPVADFKALPEAARVLIVGKDALDAVESTSSRLAAYAAPGRAVLVLEQKTPLKYQAVPAEIDAATNEGRVGFGEDMEHPVMRGLAQKDLFTWGPDEILYRNAYVKPVRGAKSLVQCDHLLANSCLVEVPTGKGLLLLSQIVIGEKLAENAVAQQLLENLVAYAAGYKQTFRPAVACTADAPELSRVLDAMGLQYSKAADPLAALATPGAIAVVHATPANLKVLADNGAKVDQFTQTGGYLLLNGLTPEGLESYNKLVGVDHMIRPFKRERVLFPPVRDPLTAGLTTGDVALYTSKRIFSFTDGNYVVPDQFSYVVDFDEVAPFGKSSFFAYDNIVNGFTNADGWPLIINFEIPKDFSPYDVPIDFPKPQTITEFTWIGNTNYWPQTKVNLIFDDDKSKVISYDVQPTGEAQTHAVNPPRAAKRVTVQIAGWQEVAGKKPLVGIDNIYLKAQRSPEFYAKVKPLLNVGGMMRYPRGAGGIVLCNLLLKETEEVPLNAVKKQNILATLLRNLKAPFASGRSVIAGANLAYAPIDLSKHATAFRNEKGWFGDKTFHFRDLPTGKQKLAGVLYDVYEFATSPVPTVILLGGNRMPPALPMEVKGIPVNRKADALFFLHAARIDQRRTEKELKEKKQFELFRYVVTYADGQTQAVPIYAETDVEHYRQDTAPKPIPGAQLAWARQYEGTTTWAAAYSKQWNNPRPEVEIKSIDVTYPSDIKPRGVPAVLAITAASAAAEAR